MLLCEELALMAVDPKSGRHALGARGDLNACLAGLLVAELIVAGHAAVGSDKRDVVLTGTGPDAAALDTGTLAAAARVVAGKGPRLKAVLSAMDRALEKDLGTGTWEAAVGGLVAAGVLGPAEGTFRPKHEILDPTPGETLVARLQAAGRGEGDQPDIRTALLLGMTGPASLLETVAPRRTGRRDARQRIDHALDGTNLEVIGKTVRALISENQAAGVGAATTGAIVSGS